MMLFLFFFLLLAITAGIVLYTGRPSVAQKAAQARLSQLSRPQVAEASDQIQLSSKSNKRLTDKISAQVQNYHLGASLERLILHSGSEATVGQVVLASVGIAIFAGLIADYFAGTILAAIPAAAVGAFLPQGFLLFKKSRRLKKFNDALADAIELMARALKAGHSMASSIEVIAEQSPEPLASEFAACFQQQKFGIPFRDTLMAMGERVPCDDLHFLLTAVLVQKETGGDLVDILERTTHLIRDRVRIQGEIKTYTAQGRMTGWILGLMPVFMLLILNVITPGYSDILFHDPLGQKLLMAGGGLIVIGGLIIRKIVDIKV